MSWAGSCCCNSPVTEDVFTPLSSSQVFRKEKLAMIVINLALMSPILDRSLAHSREQTTLTCLSHVPTSVWLHAQPSSHPSSYTRTRACCKSACSPWLAKWQLRHNAGDQAVRSTIPKGKNLRQVSGHRSYV